MASFFDVEDGRVSLRLVSLVSAVVVIIGLVWAGAIHSSELVTKEDLIQHSKEPHTISGVHVSAPYEVVVRVRKLENQAAAITRDVEATRNSVHELREEVRAMRAQMETIAAMNRKVDVLVGRSDRDERRRQ